VVFDLIDELIDVCEADAFHAGLDEVFEIGMCPRCVGTPNSELFAEWVNALHGHIVGRRGVEMLMWADRLFDGLGTVYEYTDYEASQNGTAAAIDHMPKDIILCDWHYDKLVEYPSVTFFTGKGFRVLACPWKGLEAAQTFLGYAAGHVAAPGSLLGTLLTTWCDSSDIARYLLEGRRREESRIVEWCETFDRLTKPAGD
jgi:hypothetical protein